MDYDEIADAFIRANLIGSPAELHGFLCGEISGREFFSEDFLATTVAGFLDIQPERVEDLGDTLIDLYRFSVDQINSTDFQFSPLLPDDDFSLNERLVSLSEWCQGFLYGLGNVRSSLKKESLGNTAEALNDLVSISNVQLLDERDGGDDDDNEASYIELVEYIRVAVATICGEMSVRDKIDLQALSLDRSHS
jgi:uncharacterized protein|tara:strand:- start:1146 stop:1724 length:579 start_codon:yes stop_codon:yes gene_type:complete